MSSLQGGPVSFCFVLAVHNFVLDVLCDMYYVSYSICISTFCFVDVSCDLCINYYVSYSICISTVFVSQLFGLHCKAH